MTAIQTKGVGVRITSHLNLTKTLADVWGPPRVVIAGTPQGWPSKGGGK